MNARLVRDTIDSGRVVTKAPVGSIGTSTCDQIVKNFLLQLGPSGVGKQKNALCLGLGVRELIPSSASDTAAQSTEEVLGVGKVCRLFPWL